MKKIINGKKYDTCTAKQIGVYEGNWNPADIHYYVETLYRKRTGEYFLHGEGGPATRCAVEISQNSWSGGERIDPISLAEAKEWAENHLSADECKKEFGVVEE